MSVTHGTPRNHIWTFVAGLSEGYPTSIGVQAMAGPIFETFQDFSSGHMLVQAVNMRACRMQAKCRQCQTNVAYIVRPWLQRSSLAAAA